MKFRSQRREFVLEFCKELVDFVIVMIGLKDLRFKVVSVKVGIVKVVIVRGGVMNGVNENLADLGFVKKRRG